jgi:hypothetical protein
MMDVRIVAILVATTGTGVLRIKREANAEQALA